MQNQKAPVCSLWTITPDKWRQPEGGWAVPRGRVPAKSAAAMKREENQLRPFRTRVRAQSFSRVFA